MKKVNFIIMAIVIGVFAIMTSSCSQRLVDFTIISSKNINMNFDVSHGKQVEGTSNGFLGIGASIKDAMDEALQSAGPEYDILVNGVVRYNDYVVVLGYKVTGTAVSSSKLKAMLGEEGFENWCKANNIFDPSKATVMK